MKYEKICEMCNNKFVTTRNVARFCTINCSNERHKSNADRKRICLNCNKEFLIKNMAYDKRSPVKYCCKKCNSEHNRKHIFNHNYFDEINTSNKAYIIGYLWADGNNTNDEICLSLQKSDSVILEKILMELESNNTIKTRKRIRNEKEFYYSDIRFSSRKMCSVLSSYGMIKAKTKTLEFPKMIPNEFIADFVRGYFDGDGCVSVNTKIKNWTCSFSIYCESKVFLTSLYNWFVENDIEIRLHEKTISSGKKQVIYKIYNKFYRDENCLCLDRKRTKFKTFLTNKCGICV